MSNTRFRRPRLTPDRGGRRFRPRTYAIGALAAAVVIAGGVGTLAATVGSDDVDDEIAAPSSTPGERWHDGIREDFAPVNSVVQGYLKAFEDWRRGKEDGSKEQAANLVASSLPVFIDTRTNLADREPFPQAPEALADYRRTISLFIESNRVAKVATDMTDSDLRDQVQLIATRVRTLGDRLFDVGQAEIAPYEPPSPLETSDSLEFIPADDVPEWSGLNLDSGPPLDDPEDANEARSNDDDERPEQSFARWADDVADADVPDAADVEQAITDGSAADLQELSVAFTDAANELYDAADPKDAETTATRTQLALLVYAEATRTAHAASLADEDTEDLRRAAKALTVIGDMMWSDRLDARDTGFPDSLLSRSFPGSLAQNS